MKAYGFDKLYI